MCSFQMNLDSNPFEAGLDYFIHMEKPVDFIGKSSLSHILREGLNRKLTCLKVDTKHVDPEGNESVWCSNKVSQSTYVLIKTRES